MSDYLVDTNVCVMVNKTVADVNTESEVNCIEQSLDWLTTFAKGQDRLVVDDDSKILNEYYKYIRPGTRAKRLLRGHLIMKEKLSRCLESRHRKVELQ